MEPGGNAQPDLSHTTALGDEPREKECPTMRSRPLVSFGLLVVIALALSGCDAIKGLVSGTPVVNHVFVSAKVGKPGAAVNGTLKPGTPSDLPLWEGSDVTKSKVTKSTAGTSWTATVITHDAYKDVATGMGAGFQKAGWQVESQDVGSVDSSQTALSVSGSSGTGIVTIAAQKDKTTRIDYVIVVGGN